MPPDNPSYSLRYYYRNREACIKRQNDIRNRRKPLAPDDPRHGEYATYVNWRCRCEKCSKAKRLRHILRTYGLTREAHDELLEAQGYVCAICRDPSKKLTVDHCHHTGFVRGFLCSMCNSGIGKLGDSIERVQSALRYLQERQPNHD